MVLEVGRIEIGMGEIEANVLYAQEHTLACEGLRQVGAKSHIAGVDTQGHCVEHRHRMGSCLYATHRGMERQCPELPYGNTYNADVANGGMALAACSGKCLGGIVTHTHKRHDTLLGRHG